MRTYLLGCSILSYHHHHLSNKGILVLLATNHSTPYLGQLGQCKSFANLLPDRRVSNHILSPFQRPEEEQWNSNRSTSSSSRAKTAPVPALSTWTKLEGQLPKESVEQQPKVAFFVIPIPRLIGCMKCGVKNLPSCHCCSLGGGLTEALTAFS